MRWWHIVIFVETISWLLLAPIFGIWALYAFWAAYILLFVQCIYAVVAEDNNKKSKSWGCPSDLAKAIDSAQNGIDSRRYMEAPVIKIDLKKFPYVELFPE